jgi:branched-chain amino acid transport system permease protein
MLEKRLQRRHPLVQTFLDNWVYVVILIFLWRFPYLVADWTNSEVAPASPRLASQSKFWQGIMIEVFILGILAMSYNLMFGFTGVISFGHGVFFGTGAYTVAVLYETYGASFVEAIFGALIFALLYSTLWALAAFRLKGVYFAMFTLAFAQIFFELSRLTLFDFLTRGDDGFTWTVPEWISPIRNRLQLYNIALVVFILSFLFVRRLMNSPSGKVLLAIRENEQRAETLGFNVYIYKTMAIMVSALLASIAGIIHAILNRQVAPSALGLERTVDPLIMTLIGGTGTLPGPVIGAALLRIGEEYLKKPELMVDIRFVVGRYTATVNSEQYWAIGLGLAFIIFVMAIPYGVVGSGNMTWLNIRRWFRAHIYTRLLKGYPRLAVWAEPITGEPPEMVQALAQQTDPMSITQWIRQHPGPSMNSLIAIVGLGAFIGPWVVTGSFDSAWRVGVEWALFLALVSVPVRLGLWVRKLFL